MSDDPAERVRSLLLRADNLLKNSVPGGDDARRAEQARAALEEAQATGADPAVPDRVRELIERRIAALDALEAGDA